MTSLSMVKYENSQNWKIDQLCKLPNSAFLDVTHFFLVKNSCVISLVPLYILKI